MIWVTCGEETMSYHHGWGCNLFKLLPTSKLDIYKVFEHINMYVVHKHMVATLLRYTHPTFSYFGDLGHLLSQNDVITSWLRLPSYSSCFSHLYQTFTRVYKKIGMLSIGISGQPYSDIPTLLGSDFGVLGHMWRGNDVITLLLKLPSYSNCFPHPY